MKKNIAISTIITLVTLVITCFSGMIIADIVATPVPFNFAFIAFFASISIKMITLTMSTIDALAWELHNDEETAIAEAAAEAKAAEAAAEYAARRARYDAEKEKRINNEHIFKKFTREDLFYYRDVRFVKYIELHKNFCRRNKVVYLGVIECAPQHKNDVLIAFNDKNIFKAAIREAVRNDMFYRWSIIDKITWER